MQQQKQRQNAGVLRSAQNDKLLLYAMTCCQNDKLLLYAMTCCQNDKLLLYAMTCCWFVGHDD
jgi:hypothetical protein